MEMWLPVKGFEEFYTVSDSGRVQSLIGRGRWKGTRLLKGTVNSCGYRMVLLVGHNGQRKVGVATLVAEAFLGDRPTKFYVCHNNGQPLDNRLSNLRYDTPTNNLADRHRHGTAPVGERGPGHKLREADVIRILKDARLLREIAADAGISITQAYVIKTGRQWKHLFAKHGSVPYGMKNG